MSIKSTIAAVAASPFLFAGAAFAGPYVNVESNISYPDGDYSGVTTDLHIGYEGTTEGGLGYYVSAGPTVGHTESADEFGDVELTAYLGGTYDKFYAEVQGTTADDDLDLAGKVGVKFTF